MISDTSVGTILHLVGKSYYLPCILIDYRSQALCCIPYVAPSSVYLSPARKPLLGTPNALICFIDNFRSSHFLNSVTLPY